MLTFKTFGRRYAVPLWKWYAAGMIFLAGTSLITLEIPQLAKTIINSLEGDAAQARTLSGTALAIIGLGVVQILARSLSRIFIFWPGRDIEARAKSDLFAKAMSLPQQFFLKHGMGDLISRLANDMGHMRVFFAFGVLQALNLFFLFVFAVYMMASVHAKLTFFCMLPLALMLVITRVIVPKMHRYSRMNQEAQGRLTNKVTEAFVNVHVIQANGVERAFLGRAAVENEEFYHSNIRLILVRTLLFPLMTTLTSVAQLVVLFYGGYEVIAGRLSVGDILAFNIYLAYLAFPLSALGILLSMYQRAITALARLSDIEVETPEHADPGKARGSSAAEPLLEVRHLTYAFPAAHDGDRRTEPVLRDVSLALNDGEKVGLFGAIGSGKSTLFNLITRVFDPPPGTIFWRGRDVLTYEPSALRREIGYALQGVHLFSDSIRGNMQFGMEPRAEESALVEAARDAQILGEIESFDDGWATEIGERGLRLSGGQKQRLALARLFLRNPRAMLLDDVLSAVDHQTEQRLIQAIHRRRSAAIIASHRVSALKQCDRVYVMASGVVIDQGRYAELRGRIRELEEESHDQVAE